MKKVIYGLLAFSPVLALAQNLGQLPGLVTSIRSLLNMIIPVLIALAVVYFFWGLAKFVRGAGDPKATAEGKGIMIWGIVAILIMVALWGILGWLINTLGLGGGGAIIPPTI